MSALFSQQHINIQNIYLRVFILYIYLHDALFYHNKFVLTVKGAHLGQGSLAK